MAQTHLVAIGGTGQHVALSYVDFAVLAEWLLPVDPCRLWLFDADAGAPEGATTAWDDACKQVQFLRRRSRPGENHWTDPLSSQHRPYLEAQAQIFEDAICRRLAPIYFDDEQRRVSFRNGYYGEAAVASTVFGALLADEEQTRGFTDLLNAPRLGDARVVVAGSAVGGTGSGCLPRLVEALAKSAGRSANGRIMAILYLPWFRLEGADGKAAKRNDEMAARTASGLFYYNGRLRDHSAAVIIGHPDVNASRVSRPWQGDTQQQRHDDLSLPFYGASIASQFFANERATPYGLYSVASNESGNQLVSEHLPLGAATDTSAQWTASKLVKANLELCRRLYWIARYIETLGQTQPVALSDEFDLPALRGLPTKIGDQLDGWIRTKLVSLNRVEATLRGTTKNGAPTSDGETRAWAPPPAGLKTLRLWIPTEPFSGAEGLVLAVARRLLNDDTWTNLEQLPTSIARLLPGRTATAVVQVQPRRVAIGTAAPMDTHETDALIAHEKVKPRALPTARARAEVLAGVFDGRLGKAITLKPLFNAVLDPTFEVLDVSTTQALVQTWFLVMLGLAAGKVTMHDVIPTRSPIQIQADGEALRVLTWRTSIGDEFDVAYGTTTVGFVPSARDSSAWAKVVADLPVADRHRHGTVVASWATMLNRAAEATRTEPPDWLRRLHNDWGKDLPRTSASFGLTDSSLPVRWSNDRHVVAMRFPVSGRRADSTWAEFYAGLGLTVSQGCPPGDKVAQDIRNLLNDPERCPRFLYTSSEKDAENRTAIALWQLPVGHPRCDLHYQAAAKIHDRYYISVQAGHVWDVQVEGMVVQVVEPAQVLLRNVGYLSEGEDQRVADYPVRASFLDLVDLTASTAPPRLDGNKVHYTLHFRGYPTPIEHVATRDDSLMLPAGILMWPNFTAPGWTQRYIWARLQGAEPMECRILSSDHASGPITSTTQVRLPSKASPVALTLPAHSHIPRVMVLDLKRREHGSFRLDLRHLERSGKDCWGVDFGTSGSVVAAVRDGGDWTQAKLLSPGPKTDSTYKVLLGEPARLERVVWFPSWDGMAARTTNSSVLPTRILVDIKEPEPDRILKDRTEYGKRWLLDHGGTLDPQVLKSYKVLDQLKWGKNISHRRHAYLLRLLEQAAAWRASTFPSGANPDALPNEVTTVFTLPLRMKDELRAFEADVKQVLADLKTLTGITFHPRFQWESNAGAVPTNARKREVVYATIDLGGGSLDFWGCFVDKSGKTHQHADSLLLGGGALIRALSRAGNAAFIDTQLRKLGAEDPAADALSEVVGYSDKVSFFFETVREVCARWLTALAVEARRHGSPVDHFNVGMLGRAWFMGGPDWRSSTKALRLIESRMKSLGQEVSLSRHRDVPEGQTDRKTYLARYVAGFSNDAHASLTNHTEEHEGFLGTDLTSEDPKDGTKASIPWTMPLPIPCDEGTRLFLLHGRTNDLSPPLPNALADVVLCHENTVLDRINQPGGDKFGYRDAHGAHLIQSPLHALIEATLNGWAGDE
jgi:hypothetical protein